MQNKKQRCQVYEKLNEATISKVWQHKNMLMFRETTREAIISFQ